MAGSKELLFLMAHKERLDLTIHQKVWIFYGYILESDFDNRPLGGVFGIPLTMSIKYAKTTVGYVDEDNVKHTKAGAIPIVVAKCGSYLKKNGK